MWVETISPRVESRGPEVHSKGLGFLHELNGGITSWNMADLMSINGPGNVVWGPGHLVSVPVGARLEIVGVVVRLQLVVAVSVDNVHAEWVAVNRGHNLDVELVPAPLVESWTIPVGEERRNCSLSVWGLHSRDEFSVCELLVGGH